MGREWTLSSKSLRLKNVSDVEIHIVVVEECFRRNGWCRKGKRLWLVERTNVIVKNSLSWNRKINTKYKVGRNGHPGVVWLI